MVDISKFIVKPKPKPKSTAKRGTFNNKQSGADLDFTKPTYPPPLTKGSIEWQMIEVCIIFCPTPQESMTIIEDIQKDYKSIWKPYKLSDIKHMIYSVYREYYFG